MPTTPIPPPTPSTKGLGDDVGANSSTRCPKCERTFYGYGRCAHGLCAICHEASCPVPPPPDLFDDLFAEVNPGDDDG